MRVFEIIHQHVELSNLSPFHGGAPSGLIVEPESPSICPIHIVHREKTDQKEFNGLTRDRMGLVLPSE